MAITMYGIRNCDTVRAARGWMKDREIDYRFVDFRADRLQPAIVQDWFDEGRLADSAQHRQHRLSRLARCRKSSGRRSQGPLTHPRRSDGGQTAGARSRRPAAVRVQARRLRGCPRGAAPMKLSLVGQDLKMMLWRSASNPAWPLHRREQQSGDEGEVIDEEAELRLVVPSQRDGPWKAKARNRT